MRALGKWGEWCNESRTVPNRKRDRCAWWPALCPIVLDPPCNETNPWGEAPRAKPPQTTMLGGVAAHQTPAWPPCWPPATRGPWWWPGQVGSHFAAGGCPMLAPPSLQDPCMRKSGAISINGQHTCVHAIGPEHCALATWPTRCTSVAACCTPPYENYEHKLI